MSWITVDTGLVDHPKIAALPNDTARWGWMVTLLEAKRQKTAGTFASPKHYRHVLGKLGRYLQDYLNAGLLDDVDGRLDIHDWPEYQRDRTNADRQQRFREKGVSEASPSRSSNGESNGPRAGAGVVAVPVVSSTEGVVKGEPDAVDAFYRRTSEVPGPKIRSWLNDLGEAHGERRLASMIDDTPSSGMNVPDYLKAVQNRLRLEDIAAERQEKRDEERRVAEKRRPIPIRPVEEPEISAEEADRMAREYMAQAKAVQ